MKKTLAILISFLSCISMAGQTWPAPAQESKPYTRWWWMGSAVDRANLSWSLEQYAGAGIGGVEITPIYGVQDNEANDIPFLSGKWMEMLKHTTEECRRLGLQVDMNTGTGWPFGGPEVSITDAATHPYFQEYSAKGGERLDISIDIKEEKQKGVAYLDRLMAYRDGERLDITSRVKGGRLDWTAPEGGEWKLIALFVGKSFQEVNRAAPGGEGLVMDHYSASAVKRYLDKFDKAFGQSGADYPDTFFNDSYEVYDAEWTPGLLDEFFKRRGYRLEEYFPEFLDKQAGRSDISSRVISDYRETLSDMLKENFTRQWTDWAHSHGSRTRNQAHGSPGNLIDLYGIVDIPECEGFGLSEFGIKGLRTDHPYTRKNDCDLSMLKYASSAAHISGKPLTSSETFTWLTEHFRTSLSQCKPDLDLMFVAGVNHIFYHGSAYSPKDEVWPGWKFYASVDMSPTNPQWDIMPEFDTYIRRCQSFLQYGKPDNDFLLYLPIYDMWHNQPGTYLAFEIDHMNERTPEFIEVVNTIDRKGFDVDYISDDFIRGTVFRNGRIVTSGGAEYKALVIPSNEFMPSDVLEHILDLAEQGADVVFTGRYPSSVPGLGNLKERQKIFAAIAARLPEADFSVTQAHKFGHGRIVTGSDYSRTLSECRVDAEDMKTAFGLHCIRREYDGGHIYFVSSLQSRDVDSWVPLGTEAASAEIYDPMSGRYGRARTRTADGHTEIYLQLRSGESAVIKTYADEISSLEPWHYNVVSGDRVLPVSGWTVSFVESEPAINGRFHMEKPHSWTEISHPDVSRNCGTALYKAVFKVNDQDASDWILNLGDVRESARVRINGHDAGCAWAVPYELNVGQYLRKGRNVIEIEVTNLPANRIADYDRKGIVWRRFKNINTVNIHYEPSDYSGWAAVPSGLCSEVYLTPVKSL